ncbi:hypothetical protein Tco_1243906 [Tanacetum coccineum]
MRTSKYGEYNAYVLDDPTLRAGNPVKEILLKLNPPDHRYNILYCKKVLTKLEVKSKGITTSSQKESRFTTSCSIDKDKYMMKAQVHVSKSSAISDVQALPQKNIIDKIARLLASFQDREHEGGDTRSQGGIRSRMKILRSQ